jgi:signal transduction histidine kinase
MLVDDNSDDRLSVMRCFLRLDENIQFIEADNAEDALQQLPDASIDCVLLDYHLPGMSGVDFLDRLFCSLEKKDWSSRQLIVMSTGQGNEKVAVQSIKSGAYDYVVKGMGASHCQVLQSTILRAVREYRATMEHFRERDQLQAQVNEAQKYQAIGRLAGGIAHEFNNMLQPIVGCSEMILKRLPQEDMSREGLELILRAGQRSAKLVRQILDFSHKSFDEDRRPMDFYSSLEEAMRLVKTNIPSNIEMILHLGAQGAGMVVADETRMNQVVMNLCNNAIDAMKGRGGSLGLCLRGVDLDEEKAKDLAVPCGQYLRLNVVDEGCGMDAETRDTIFDPFFTTKPVGEGTGMGLAVVQGIISGHGGAVVVESEPNLGSTFTIYLPRFIASKDSLEVQAQVIPRVIKKKLLVPSQVKILLVDDEEVVRLTCEEMLEDEGYPVVSCHSAESAREVLSKQSFNVVLTDYSMQEEDGLSLARYISQQYPTLPIILCSGYQHSLSDEVLHAAGIKRVLVKPVEIDILSSCVQEVILSSR